MYHDQLYMDLSVPMLCYATSYHNIAKEFSGESFGGFDAEIDG